MFMKWLQTAGLIWVLGVMMLLPVANAAPSTEVLHYHVFYQGPLTAGNRVSIADIELRTSPAALPDAQSGVTETSMSVSSAAYDFVEDKYPFRVHIRSLYQDEPMISLALEKYQKTDELKHEVSWMDLEDGKVLRFRKKSSNQEDRDMPLMLQTWLASSPEFGFYKFARHGVRNNLVDYLAMLQKVRRSPLDRGDRYRFPVTDGKKLYDYVVTVENGESTPVEDRSVGSWKVRFDGYRLKKGERRQDHRPVYAWFSKDESRVPLKFESRHPLGRFVIELTGTSSDISSGPLVTSRG